jgi:ABC-type uncharacterized transport system permease subunit
MNTDLIVFSGVVLGTIFMTRYFVVSYTRRVPPKVTNVVQIFTAVFGLVAALFMLPSVLHSPIQYQSFIALGCLLVIWCSIETLWQLTR